MLRIRPKKRRKPVIIAKLPRQKYVLRDETIAALKAAEEEEKNGRLTYYSTAEEFMSSLDQ